MTKSTRAFCFVICVFAFVSVVIADGSSSIRGLRSFPKYCHGTSIACQSDDECISSSSSNTANENDHTSPIVACAYPFEETAVEAPNHSKKVKVFIMMGQSNMVGYGQVGPEETQGTLLHSISEGKYPHLVKVNHPNPSTFTWSERKDVRIVYRRSSTRYWQSDLKVGWNGSDTFIGPEIQFGNIMGHIYDNPVLIIKVGTGNRSLGFDFLPKGSERYTYGDRSFPGHGQCPQSSLSNAIPAKVEDCNMCNHKSNMNKDCPVFWTSKDMCRSTCGTGLYAGHQFDEDFQNAVAILNDIEQYYPGYNGQGFEISGFVFWQGHKDTLLEAHASRYSINMKRYIEAIWGQYRNYPGEKKFVHATVAHGGCNDNISSNKKLVYNAQRTISGDQLSYFQGKVTAVDARSYWRENSVSPAPTKSHHYYNNADTYMEVGNALGWAMADLLFESVEYTAGSCDTRAPSTSPTTACGDDLSYTWSLTNTGQTVDCNWLTTNLRKKSNRKKVYCNNTTICTRCAASCDSPCETSTEVPISTPTSGVCKDSNSFSWKLQNGNTVGCNWLTKKVKKRDKRKKLHCANSNIHSQCAATCDSSCSHLVPPNSICADNALFTFNLLIDGSSQYCSWIDKNINKIKDRRKKYCNRDVLSACPKACGGCINSKARDVLLHVGNA